MDSQPLASFFLVSTKDVEAIDHFQFRGWDSYLYLYLNWKMEAEAGAVEAALNLTASTSLD